MDELGKLEDAARVEGDISYADDVARQMQAIADDQDILYDALKQKGVAVEPPVRPALFERPAGEVALHNDAVQGAAKSADNARPGGEAARAETANAFVNTDPLLRKLPPGSERNKFIQDLVEAGKSCTDCAVLEGYRQKCMQIQESFWRETNIYQLLRKQRAGQFIGTSLMT